VTKFFGGRIAAAVLGLFAFGLASGAAAESLPALNVSAAVKAVAAESNSALIGTPAAPSTLLVRAAVAHVATPQPVNAKLATSIATEAAWLFKGGWPLYALVEKYSAGAALDEQSTCLATAVYFEARGESLEGQLAVAHVVMNRAGSGRYPPDWCSVVKQRAQFSFVRHGAFPWINAASAAWSKAQAIARLAAANVVPSVDPDVLWYHATYVAPSWGHRLSLVQKIGLHLFYRA
jgi:N-acetylmuramoyl-L-alanine amidase